VGDFGDHQKKRIKKGMMLEHQIWLISLNMTDLWG
jgi:hypothetical protein